MNDENSTEELSVRVVLYRSGPGGERTLICPDSEDVLDSSTVLIAPAAVPVAVVRALLASEVPAEFAQDPWLDRHRALVFVDGRCRVGRHELRYHEKFGVYGSEEP
ncbi:hypothetical protein ATK36_0712 [Amycolatopsis sulphurea]|uniref:Cas3 C-terminal domain-containing protein n=1 Tax=Amycolatopsis sulphurea TaxID=76022 RepID=A0A2A9G147_9PSEU|nr:hypothetical protein [Amycolatopsis sulphurea]PFG57148.1 hypothetical protein ATK36_0712 [Amycolatopsis sulphurea]